MYLICCIAFQYNFIFFFSQKVENLKKRVQSILLLVFWAKFRLQQCLFGENANCNKCQEIWYCIINKLCHTHSSEGINCNLCFEKYVFLIKTCQKSFQKKLFHHFVEHKYENRVIWCYDREVQSFKVTELKKILFQMSSFPNNRSLCKG